MWFLVLLGTAGYSFFIYRIYKSLHESKKNIADINKNIRWYNRSKENHISEAIDTAVINGADITSDDFESLDTNEKIKKLQEFRETDEFLKENEQFSHIMRTVEMCDMRIKDKKSALSRQIDSYNDSLNHSPARYFASYLGFKKEPLPGQRISRKKQKKERLEFLKDYVPETIALIIKVAIDVFCVDMAILAIHYCTLGKNKNPLIGLLGFICFAIGIYIIMFSKKKRRGGLKLQLWSLSLIIAFVCILGMAFHKEPKTDDDGPIPILTDLNKPKAIIDSPYAIAQVLDIDNTTINGANKYAWTDLENGFAKSVGNTLDNKMDGLLEIVTANNQSLPNFYAANNNERRFSKKQISMYSIALLTPKNTASSSKGYIKIIYKLDIGFSWKDETGKSKNILTPVFVSYTWDANLNSKTAPISDFGAYKFNYDKADTDYNKWLQKNIDTDKDRYNVDIRIMHK